MNVYLLFVMVHEFNITSTLAVMQLTSGFVHLFPFPLLTHSLTSELIYLRAYLPIAAYTDLNYNYNVVISSVPI